ncbi:enoyl-CoA hydratase/isomerase family protein [Dyadobacter subterraneus]|uniref:Enoyl-CoA hydratase/isomerase family protein n=1 Tax=Dyadobacter subterraneus TaxID=2773304 RepID=A0ABR9WIB8_9BACT|nr:enoyl-CoA hydratase-related protein [Dyadobacter subterraneus]MBE9465267.1 enoyl-CoA hydratase/isomerase family protein [Dyadobacter subterraneus]
MLFFKEEDVAKFDTIQFLFIKTSLKGNIFEITLNRPEKRNAFTPTMANEIAFALAYAKNQIEIRCVIIKAKGPVFCAGADLNAFHDPTIDQKNQTLPEPVEEVRLGDAFANLHKPCIAQVEGSVFAGGFLIICGCTFVVSIPEANFSLPEVKRGIWPMQVMASLIDIIPKRKILEMSITGKSYSAEEALHLGIVTQISDKELIEEEVNKLANLICSNAPYAIKSGMEALQNLSEIEEDKRHNYLKSQLENLLKSEDAKEGTAAFKDKRTPIWKGK